MLPPDARVLLSEQLRPEPGQRLEHAVATTFTLDLSSALLVPLAFAGSRLRDETDPIAVMDSVRASADRVDIFCQAGAVHAPRQASDLFAFLEPVIHPVSEPGRLFHPKLWLARYAAEDGSSEQYRLLVLSRNLTDDRCWDTCLRLDGSPGTRPRGANKPLVDLLRWLPEHAVAGLPERRRDNVERLAEEVRRVEWELPEGTTALDFYAPGVPGHRRPTFDGSRHLVISPFCNDGGLNLVAPPETRELTLVARQEQLDALPAETVVASRPYVLSAQASLEQDYDDMLAGLHAKIYVIEYNRQARMLLGSANATQAAWRANVEFMVELRGGTKALGIDTLWNSGDRTCFADLLEPYAPQPLQPPHEAGWELEELLRNVAATPLTAQVSTVGDRYRLELSSAAPVPLPPEGSLTVELLTVHGTAVPVQPHTPVKAAFESLRVVEVTPFVLLRAAGHGEHRSAIVQARLTGDPADRLDEILARQIDTPEKFLRFVILLLGLTGGDADTGLGTTGNQQPWSFRETRPGGQVFEMLLRAMVDRPEAIDDLARTVARMQATDSGRATMPDGFSELWAVVHEARRALQSEVSE